MMESGRDSGVFLCVFIFITGQMPIYGAKNGLERGGHDVAVDAYVKAGSRVADAQFHISGSSACIRAGADGMLVVVHDAHGHIQRGDEGRDSAIALPLYDAAFTVVFQIGFDAEVLAFLGAGVAVDMMAHQFPRRVLFQVFGVEHGVNVIGRDFTPGLIGDALNGAAEFDLQTTGQNQTVLLF